MVILSCKDRSQELLGLNTSSIHSKKTKRNKKQIGNEFIEDTNTILKMGYESLSLGTSETSRLWYSGDFASFSTCLYYLI